MEDGYIVKHKSYYFCKEFLSLAAKELKVRLDEDKELFGNNGRLDKIMNLGWTKVGVLGKSLQW